MGEDRLDLGRGECAIVERQFVNDAVETISEGRRGAADLKRPRIRCKCARLGDRADRVAIHVKPDVRAGAESSAG